MKPSRSLSAKTRKEILIRRIFQIAVFLGAMFLPVGIFHMICPFGGIATLTRLLSQGLYINKTSFSNLVLLASVVLTTIIAGPVFCGWLCPLGSIQEWINSLAQKMRIPQVKLSKKVERFASLPKYALLLLILYTTARSFNLVFINADPYYALMHLFSNEVAPLALMILIFTLFASLFIQRPWCRFLCPLGAILGPLGRVSILKIHRPSKTCISCGCCKNVCPVGLDPTEKEHVESSRCIRCGLCETSCPPKLRNTRHTFTLSLIIALMVFSVSFFTAHDKISEIQSPTQSSQTFTVKMQSTLLQVAEGTNSSLSSLYTLLGLPSDYDANTQLVDIEDDYEDKTWSWVQAQLL